VLRASSKNWTVVGVILDLRHAGPEKPAQAEAFFPISHGRNVREAELVIRTARPISELGPTLTAALRSTSPPFHLSSDWSGLDGQVDRIIAGRRFSAAVFSVFGIFGLLLSSAAVYGLTAYTIANRRHDMAIRVAIGATPSDVTLLLIRHTATLVAIGSLIGTTGVWFLGPLVSPFLFRVQPHAALPFVVTGVVLLASAFLPALAAAHRAASLPPMQALRGG
jgi:ABC-type antimicrobial peptide transport system permease subunit